jgi:hypothetical protein
MDLGGLARALGHARTDVICALEASREGRVDPESHRKAEEIAATMSTPVPPALPALADAVQLDDVEAELGFVLPRMMRRIYSEVADGGFGREYGLLPISEVVSNYRDLRTSLELPRGRSWPEGLLPLVTRNPGWGVSRRRQTGDRVGSRGALRAERRGAIPAVLPRDR